MNLVTRRTNCEEVNARRTKVFMSLEDCAQSSIPQSNSLVNPSVAVNSVITNLYVKVLNPLFVPSLPARNASDSVSSAAMDRTDQLYSYVCIWLLVEPSGASFYKLVAKRSGLF